MAANLAYLLVAAATCDAVGSPWEWMDALLFAVMGVAAPDGGGWAVGAARWASDSLFQSVFMLPVLVLVTVASTVWWNEVASTAAEAAAEAGPAGRAAESRPASSASVTAASAVLRIVALLLVQVEAAVLDGVGRSLAPSLLVGPGLPAACARGASVVCAAAVPVHAPAVWWALGAVLRLAACAALCAVYSHTAIDSARVAAGAGGASLRRMLDADGELPFLLGAGLPLTAVSVLAGEWGGLHVSTAAYGLGFSLLAASASASAAAVASPSPREPGAARLLFGLNAAVCGWIASALFA